MGDECEVEVEKSWLLGIENKWTTRGAFDAMTEMGFDNGPNVLAPVTTGCFLEPSMDSFWSDCG